MREHPIRPVQGQGRLHALVALLLHPPLLRLHPLRLLSPRLALPLQLLLELGGLRPLGVEQLLEASDLRILFLRAPSGLHHRRSGVRLILPLRFDERSPQRGELRRVRGLTRRTQGPELVEVLVHAFGSLFVLPVSAVQGHLSLLFGVQLPQLLGAEVMEVGHAPQRASEGTDAVSQEALEAPTPQSRDVVLLAPLPLALKRRLQLEHEQRLLERGPAHLRCLLAVCAHGGPQIEPRDRGLEPREVDLAVRPEECWHTPFPRFANLEVAPEALEEGEVAVHSNHQFSSSSQRLHTGSHAHVGRSPRQPSVGRPPFCRLLGVVV
mmetsp:Transcript_4584/g.12776  ORF Transcript_4584/g.12776 Transcript_4584/m.12776 type:complete len:323 (+) Transcript_4584:580-1548(+)